MMDLAKIFDEKNITESTKNLYIKNLTRLNGGIVKNTKFLSDEKAIEEKLLQYKPNTRRTYVIAIVSLLKALKEKEKGKKHQKMYDKYYSIMDDLNKNLKTNNEKSEKEKENWISQEAVLERLNELKAILPKLGKKITEEQFYELQKLMVLSLYALQKPRRNKDYQDMLVHKKKPVSFHFAYDIAGNKVDIGYVRTNKAQHLGSKRQSIYFYKFQNTEKVFQPRNCY